jgi:hypothetical protein
MAQDRVRPGAEDIYERVKRDHLADDLRHRSRGARPLRVDHGARAVRGRPFAGRLAATTLGNILGGTVIVAVANYGQVRAGGG